MSSAVLVRENTKAAGEEMSDHTETTKKMVLVVEDDPDMSELLCTVLEQAGYQTAPAFNGKEALEQANNLQPALILLDIMLPDIDGIRLCRDFSHNDNTRNIPIIMVSVRQELSAKLSSYIAGARRFIVKPFRVEDLLQDVERALRQPRAPATEEEILDPRD